MPYHLDADGRRPAKVGALRHWRRLASGAVALAVLTVPVAAGAASAAPTGTSGTPACKKACFAHITGAETFGQLAEHPAFVGFGRYIGPWEAGPTWEAVKDLPLAQVAPYLSPYGWDVPTMVDGVNFLIDQRNKGSRLFHQIYSDAAIAADPSKGTAGVFFIPGKPNAPLAVVLAGGGFTSVASIQEAFPHAKRLHEAGYNVAVLKYRVSPDGRLPGREGELKAMADGTDDLAQALRFTRSKLLHKNYRMDDYALWGSSAGASIAGAWGSDNQYGAQAHGFRDPAAIISAYMTPRYSDFVGPSFPDSFVIHAADDVIAPIAGVDALVDKLRGLGVTVDYRRFDTGGHGFGLGVGTPANGWFDQALAFWAARTGPGDYPPKNPR
ncbi:alpha/beta hydrolase [Streptomyces sp. NPDC096132]|uniref:alpha/beta hydrolase n=1 Tax=Streptomyces sp. NPDC096132 TaxID=3366075 RepID=UPI0038184A71